MPQLTLGRVHCPYRQILTIGLVGRTGSGKSSMAVRLASGEFHPFHEVTLGYSLHHFPLNALNPKGDIRAIVKVYDLAGQAHFRSLWKQYGRFCDLVMYLVDVTELPPLEEMAEICSDFLSNMKKPRIQLVYTKFDLLDEIKGQDKIDAANLELRGYSKMFETHFGPLGVRRGCVSSKTGYGFTDLKGSLAQLLSDVEVSHMQLRQKEVKLVVLGPPSVGKSTFLYCAAEGMAPPKTSATIGVDLRGVELRNEKGDVIGNLILWDTGGQEKFNALTKSYLQNVDIVLVFHEACELTGKAKCVDRDYKQTVWELCSSFDRRPSIIPVYTKADLFEPEGDLDGVDVSQCEFFFSHLDPAKIRRFVTKMAMMHLA